MSLTPEDGSIVADADTYATVAELRMYAAKRGASLPATGGPGDAACEVLLAKALDYLEARGPRFKGERVQSSQPLSWPRYGVIINGWEIPSSQIPKALKDAQMALAIEAQTNDLMPTRLPGDSGAVTREAVGSLEVEYAEPISAITRPEFPRADALLAPLLSGSNASVRVVRV